MHDGEGDGALDYGLVKVKYGGGLGTGCHWTYLSKGYSPWWVKLDKRIITSYGDEHGDEISGFEDQN